MLLTHSQTFTWTDSSTDKSCRSRLDILPLSVRLVRMARKLSAEGWSVVKESLVAGLIGDSRTVIESSGARSRRGLRREILGLEDASDD
jgi:hypothetical protein